MNNLNQLGVASVMYLGENNQYPGCLSTVPDTYFVWAPRLLTYMGNNRQAFWCPAAKPWTAWDTNMNKNTSGQVTLGGTAPDGTYDPYGISRTSFFGYGYNDWGIHFDQGAISSSYTPQLGLGGDINGGQYQGPMRENMVFHPTDMIEICDVPSVPQDVAPNYNADSDPADVDTATGHSACPSNRHNFLTDVLFCDGHVESPKRNDVRNPSNGYWRARWNNDNDPHFEQGSWQGNPPWVNTLDQ